MALAYVAKLGLKPRLTNIGTQKTDGLVLETHKMTSASFLLQDSQKRVWFFEKTFLLTNSNIKVVLGMAFLAFINIDIEFIELGKLT